MADGIYKTPNSYFRSISNNLDVWLSVLGFCGVRAADSLNVLRLWKVLKYLSRWNKMELLRETTDLLRRSSIVILSILGVMIILILFFSTLLNTLVVRLL